MKYSTVINAHNLIPATGSKKTVAKKCLWKTGRNHCSMPKIDEKLVSIKFSNCVFQDSGIQLSIFQRYFILKKRQRFIIWPNSHQSGKLQETRETRMPINWMKALLGSLHVDTKQRTDLEHVIWSASILPERNKLTPGASQIAWSPSKSFLSPGFTCWCNARSCTLKFSLDKHHKMAHASPSLILGGGGAGVDGSVVLIARSFITEPSKWKACSWAIAQLEDELLKSKLLTSILCHPWLERGEAVGERRQKTHADSIACQVEKYFIYSKGLAAKKIPGSWKTYLQSLGKWFHGSLWVGSSSTAAKAVDHAIIRRGARGTFMID